ncbi:MAG: anion permease [Clostridia bacterium]|nr:anion permease [Clostridia bacterium]
MEQTKTFNVSRFINLLIGPTVFLLAYILMPSLTGISYAQAGAIGTVFWMAYWWITGPVDYAVTGLLPIAINALFQIANKGDTDAFKTGMSDILSKYADSTIMLILGASLITAAWGSIGLDRRIATRFLALIGNKMRGQIAFWFILTTILSAVLPNAVVCAAITPIAVSMLKFVGEGDIATSKKASMILLTIAYGAGAGGLASPLGGAMNLTVINFINEIPGVTEFTYINWFLKFLPIMIILAVSNILFLIFFCKKDEALEGSKEYFINEYKAMPKMSREEVMSLIFFLVPTILSFAQPLYKKYLPGLQPAYLFIIFGILSFLIKKKNGERMMNWKLAERNVVWDMLYIFGGGLAIGAMLKNSGADIVIGNLMESAGLTGGFLMILLIVTFTVIMSDVTSNTATAGIAIPIVIAMCGNGPECIPYVFAATIGVNLSYMLPTSIRAISVGYGLPPKFMLKKGVPLTVIVIALMSVTAYLFMKTGFWAQTTFDWNLIGSTTASFFKDIWTSVVSIF